MLVTLEMGCSSIWTRRMFAVRLMGFEKGRCLMRIRIRHRDKPMDRMQPVESKGFSTLPEGSLKAFYTDRKPEIRILCGSI